MPPRGSPRDLVLRELLEREQVTRVSEMGMLVRLIGLAAGVDVKNLDKAMDAYVDTLTHARYGKKTEAPPEKKDADLLKRVAELSSSAR